jgi:DNA-binding MarR family transcriptional regulator
MSSTSDEVPRAWVRLLRAHAELTRRMDASLRAEHGLGLRGYEVLLALADAPDRRLRRVDLAARLLLTQGGVTRLLEPLEREGLVARGSSDRDRRVVYAQLTPAGRRRLRAAWRTHRKDIGELFAARFSAAELRDLDALLTRLPGGEGEGDWADESAAGERSLHVNATSEEG